MEDKGFKIIGTVIVIIGLGSLGLLGFIGWALVKIINHFF